MKLTNKIFLGSLCKRNHNYNNTGKSLRYISNPGSCVICKTHQREEWVQNNNKRYKSLQKKWNSNNQSHHNKWKKEYRKLHPDKKQTNPFKKYYKGVQDRANNKNLKFDLTPEFLEQLWNSQNGKCHWLHCDLMLVGVPYHPLRATIDRLDPDKGYVQNNIVWASSFANRGRSNTSKEIFAELLPVLLNSRIM
jgi:hypothetical protein